MNIANAITLIRQHADDSTLHRLQSMEIISSKYPSLSRIIPDEVLIIDEVFPETDYEIIWDRFIPYLGKFGVFPFLSILGGNVVCIGYSSRNAGFIYYFDFDFGLYELDATLSEFIHKVNKK